MKQSLAQSEIVDVRRRCPLHPHVHMARIVHEVAKARMGLQPAATRQVHSTRRDIVDRRAAVVLEWRDLLAWLWDLLAWLLEANVHVRNGGFRRCIGSSVLDVLLRGQWHARNHPHGQPEPLVEGRRAIIGRAETIERRGMIIQSGETRLKRLTLARRRRRVRQDGSRLGWGIKQSDLRSQACQSYAIARRL